MKALESLATNKNVQGVIALAGLVGIAYWVYTKAKAEAAAAASAVANVNKGTAYEGSGVVGTLGNAANQASGGVLQSIGESIGGKLFDWFGDTYDPNAVPGSTRKQQVNDNFYNPGVLW